MSKYHSIKTASSDCAGPSATPDRFRAEHSRLPKSRQGRHEQVRPRSPPSPQRRGDALGVRARWRALPELRPAARRGLAQRTPCSMDQRWRDQPGERPGLVRDLQPEARSARRRAGGGHPPSSVAGACLAGDPQAAVAARCSDASRRSRRWQDAVRRRGLPALGRWRARRPAHRRRAEPRDRRAMEDLARQPADPPGHRTARRLPRASRNLRRGRDLSHRSSVGEPARHDDRPDEDDGRARRGAAHRRARILGQSRAAHGRRRHQRHRPSSCGAQHDRHPVPVEQDEAHQHATTGSRPTMGRSSKPSQTGPSPPQT